MSDYVLNLVPSRLDGTEKVFTSGLQAGVPLPKSINLIPGCSPVTDQKSLGSCVANALGSGLREFLMLKNKQPLIRVSRLFLYYYERLIEGTVDEDAGAEIKSGMIVLKKVGVCPENMDPYDIAKFKEVPTQQEIAEAAKYKIAEYTLLKSLNDIKKCLAEGYPVAFGMDCYSQFMSEECRKTGVVKMPAPGEKSLGGHCVLAVGFEDRVDWRGGGYVLVRNSWGPEFGLKGYFKLSYSYFLKNLAWDYWTARD